MTTKQVNDLMEFGDRIDVLVTPRFEFGMLGVTFRDMPTLFDYDRALFHLQRIEAQELHHCVGEGQAA